VKARPKRSRHTVARRRLQGKQIAWQLLQPLPMLRHHSWVRPLRRIPDRWRDRRRTRIR